MDANLTFKGHLNCCMKKAKAAEACLLSLEKPYEVVPAGVRAVQVARFIALLADVSEAFKLKKVHDYPTSGAPLCRVAKNEHERSWTAETMCWPDPGRSQQSRL